MSDRHGLSLCSDFEGWDTAECECGWVSPPCPDIETAAEFYAQHIASVFPKAVTDA